MVVHVPLLAHRGLLDLEFYWTLEAVQKTLFDWELTPFIYGNGQESLVNRGRNAAATGVYYDEDASHLLFLDTDMQVPESAIQRMFHVDAPVVGVAYPTKVFDFTKDDTYSKWAEELREKAPKLYSEIPPELREALTVQFAGAPSGTGIKKVSQTDFAATGCMLIKKEVLVALVERGKAKAYNTPHSAYSVLSGGREHYNFFPTEVHNKTLESEGQGFCRLCRELGIDIRLITDEIVSHIGKRAYKGNLFKQMKFHYRNQTISEEDIRNAVGLLN